MSILSMQNFVCQVMSECFIETHVAGDTHAIRARAPLEEIRQPLNILESHIGILEPVASLCDDVLFGERANTPERPRRFTAAPATRRNLSAST
jgi:hypothetical protein